MSKYDPLHAIQLTIFICKLHYWQMNHKGHLLVSYPVVWEVLVHYFPHLGLLGVQYGGAEVEAHIQHGCLISQRCATVLW